MTHSDPNHFVVVGQVLGVFGVRGWVRIRSETEPRENILQYRPWYLHQQGQWIETRVSASQQQSKGLIVQFENIHDRDLAARFVGCDIGVRRSQLPPPGEDEYYWADLVGLQVRNTHGDVLGTVTHLLETGANDVLVVQDGAQEYLIPYVKGYYVLAVKPEAGYIEVDWQRDYTTGE